MPSEEPKKIYCYNRLAIVSMLQSLELMV